MNVVADWFSSRSQLLNSPSYIFLPSSASSFFSDLPASSMNHMLYHRHLASVARASARMIETTQKCDRSWTRWCTFADELTFGGDPLMEQIQVRHQVIFIFLFSSALREGEFSGESRHCLSKSTIWETVDKVVTFFRTNSRANPHEDELRFLDPMCSLQLKGYTSSTSATLHAPLLLLPIVRFLFFIASNSFISSFHHRMFLLHEISWVFDGEWL